MRIEIKVGIETDLYRHREKVTQTHTYTHSKLAIPMDFSNMPISTYGSKRLNEEKLAEGITFDYAYNSL